MKRGSRIAVLSVAAILITVPAGPGRRAEAAQAKQITFTGKVLDAAGQPLEGVKVRLYQETYGSGGAYSSEMAMAAEVTVKADGSFLFAVPAGEREQSVWAPSWPKSRVWPSVLPPGT